MSAGPQEKESLGRKAAEAASQARSLLEDMRSRAGAETSLPPSEQLPAWLERIEAPVEFATLPHRMQQVAEPWRAVFLPLSILQCEGRAQVTRGNGLQPWRASLTLVEKLKAKTGGGALAAARRKLLEAGGKASWWLPAMLEWQAAGHDGGAAIRARWQTLSRSQADLSRQDSALAALALDPDAPPAFALGDAARLMDMQDGEGSWTLDEFCGPVISTAFTLDALRREGIDEREAAVLRGGEWLRSVQNADGGWGRNGEAESSASGTGCAVFGLISGGDAGSESVRRGIEYIVSTQDLDGRWDDGGWNWQLLPGYVACRSSLDALTLPLLALSSYLKRTGRRHGGGWPGA